MGKQDKKTNAGLWENSEKQYSSETLKGNSFLLVL